MTRPINVRDIRAFRPALVLEVVHRLEVQRRRVAGATSVALRARSAGESWRGPAAARASGRQGDVVVQLGDLAARLGVTASLLRGLAARMETSLDLLRRAERIAQNRGARTDADGLVHVPYRFPTGDATTDAHVGRLDALMVDEVGHCIAEAQRIAAETDADIHRRLLMGAVEPVAPTVTEHLAVLPPPPEGVGGRPDGAFANAAWWRGLTQVERRWAIANRPDWVGSRDGIPAWDRHQANLLLLARVRGQAQEELRRAGTIPQRTAVGTWEMAKSIEAIDAVLAKRDGVTRHLLLIDVTGPVVRSVTTVGDIDRAGHVTTYVGGLSTSPHSTLVGYDERMVRMRRLASGQARAAGDNSDVAIVLWMGYPAPQWRDGGIFRRSVMREDVARDWSDDLASFTNGIDASRDMPAHQTLWAHSYGSVLAGLALQHVMRIDDVALFGSPGTSLGSLAQAGLKPGSLNVLAAPTDPIAGVEWHGRDPRSIPGVATLAAVCSLKPGSTNELLKGSFLHSNYVDAAATAGHNLAVIAAGRPDLRVGLPTSCPALSLRRAAPDQR